MVFQRSIRHDLRWLAGHVAEPHYSVTAKLKLYGRRPTILCTRDLWPIPSKGPGEQKLNTLCEALGIQRHANPIDGSKVLDAYMDGREEGIVAHNLADVRDLWAVWSVLADVWRLG